MSVPNIPGVSSIKRFWPEAYEIHIMPINDSDQFGDLVLHFASPNCWCHPVQTKGLMQWSHNAQDTREKFERQTGYAAPGGMWVTVGAIP